MARAIFRGPAHVCVDVDDEMAELIGMDVLGIPVREALTDPAFRESQWLMDAVYADGLPRVLPIAATDGRPGRVVIVRLSRGVATDWRPLPVGQLRLPRPRVSVE